MSKKSSSNGVFSLLILAALFVSVWLSVSVWTLGSDSDDWEEVCIHGQVVLRANFAAKTMAVNKLDEDGRPIACVVD